MGSEFSTSKAATRLPPHDTLYLALSFVCYSTAEVKILKVISRVSYYCSMGPGRSSEPKQQCRVERPLKTNLNSLWHRTFIYLADTGSIAPGRAWHSHAPYFIHSLWINNTDSDGPTHTQVCQDVSVRVCESVHLLYVCDKSVTEQLCLEQSSRSCYFVQWLNSQFFFYLPLIFTQCLSYFWISFVALPSPLLETWYGAQIVNKNRTLTPWAYWSHTSVRSQKKIAINGN